MRRYRAAIIGCGRIGCDCGDPAIGSSRLTTHAAAYRALDRTELVALCDIDEPRLSQAGQRYGITRLYRDHRALIESERPDLISICTPADDHAPVLRDIVEHGAVAAVLLEKPVAASLAAARELARDVSGSGIPVAVNYIRRFVPVYRQLVADIRSGGLGRMQHISGLYGKGIFNNGTHLLDLLRWMFGDPSTVTGTAIVSGGCDPTMDLRITWEGGCDAWVRGTDSEAYNVFELDLVGTAGRVRLTDIGHRLERQGVDGTSFGFRQLSAVADIQETGLQDAIPAAIANLIDCIERGAQPACTLDDGCAALDLATTATTHAVETLPMRSF